MVKQIFLGKFRGGLLYIGTNDHIIQEGRKSFTNAFSSNLNTLNLKIFCVHGWTHLKINPNQSIELWSDLSLRLMVKRFQRVSQVLFPSC